jgi:hypothetical protein
VSVEARTRVSRSPRRVGPAGAARPARDGWARRRKERRRAQAGTLEIEATRVVVDGEVIESDGKTENARHVLALDPFTLAVLKVHVDMLD